MKEIVINPEFQAVWDECIKDQKVKSIKIVQRDPYKLESIEEGIFITFENDYQQRFEGLSCSGMSITVSEILSPNGLRLAYIEIEEP